MSDQLPDELERERDIARSQAIAESFIGEDGEQYTPLSAREQAWVCSSDRNRRRAEAAEKRVEALERALRELGLLTKYDPNQPGTARHNRINGIVRAALQTSTDIEEEGEVCADCRLTVRRGIGTYWRAPDELWAQVVGAPVDPALILCPACFSNRAGQRGILLGWKPFIDAKPSPESEGR